MICHILCDSSNHPIVDFIKDKLNENVGNLQFLNDADELSSGDFLFLVSCGTILSKSVLDKYNHVLVLHASNLPEGRGWSPHIWQLLNGSNEIVVSLLEAQEKVDTGDIWLQEKVSILDTDVSEEINSKIFTAQFNLIQRSLNEYKNITPYPQKGEASYFRKRTPEDSQLDITQSIESQFNLLRVCDAERYPAYFYVDGIKYTLTLDKFQK